MIGAPIPQNVLKYEAKLIAHFTAREAIIYGAGITLSAIVDFKIVPSNVEAFTKLLIAVVIMFVFVAWGKAKPFGQPLEKVIVPIIEDNWLKPNVRVRSYDRKDHIKNFEKGLKVADPKNRAKKSPVIKCY